MRKLVILILAILCLPLSARTMVARDGRGFTRDGKPYTYIGANFWYGAILGSRGPGGDRARLLRELDTMKGLGIDNLRILVGSDGGEGVKTKVEPTLQRAIGSYNDDILDGLDFLLAEMGKRGMVAVLYLNNSWEWSGGYGFYLEQAGFPPAPRPNEAGYDVYMRHVSQFSTSARAQELFYDYVRFIVGRTNRYTGRPYTADPAIMAWQIGNEPRAFAKELLPQFEAWLAKASALIRRLDGNHLISTGSEGAWGTEMDYDAYRRISADKNIDYVTIHIWPYNWGWAKADSLVENLPRAIANTDEYIGRHVALAEAVGKPLVLEEFGYPRDAMSYVPGSPATARNGYYKHIFGLVGTKLAGCNFWGWAGEAVPCHEQWEPGDDYTGDPAQEAQGLNSVFKADEGWRP